MKKNHYLLLLLFFVISNFTHGQLLHNSTGYFMDYGINNNTGPDYWYTTPYTIDSLVTEQSKTGLLIKGVNNSGTPQTGYNNIGFMQNRMWGTPYSYGSGFNIDMSQPKNMSIKIRMRATGSVMPTINVSLNDTSARFNFDSKTLASFKLTNEYQDYYYDFKNFWICTVPGNNLAPIVDSTAISGIGFSATFDSPVFDLSTVKIEIDYIQLGSYVDWPYNSIKGRVYNDNNGDCQFNANDTPAKQELIKAEPGPYYAYTDENGFYELRVDTSNTSYNVSYIPREAIKGLLENVCPTAAITVATPTSKTTYCCNDFAQKVKLCSVLKIDINSNRRRRCFRNTTYVNYQNTGTIDSKPAEIKVVYPEYVKPISSVPAWTRKVGNTLYYSIGAIATNSNQSIIITDSVVCGIEEIRFLTQCTEASISISNECIQASHDWDRADVQVEGLCDQGIARFYISNNGDGNMTDSAYYRVYANDTLISIAKFALKSQEYFVVELPTYGNVIRLEADQVANHPDYNTKPRASFEGCVAEASLLKTAYKGLVMNTPTNDDLITATSCMQIRDSYDPNDKAVFPKGQSDKHYISAGTKLDYTIRFENTGTDDAYKVVVVDTLDTDLDAATFIPVNASHKYSVVREIIDNKEIVKFVFEDINLTPKKIDSIKAQGYIKFSIATKADLTDETIIENEAGIFFDYNSAIITNKVSQTIGEYIEKDLTKGNIITRTAVGTITTDVSTASSNSVAVYPNPANEYVTLTFPSGAGKGAQITIYAVNGTALLTESLSTADESTISLNQLKQGIYYYRITDASGLNQNGKIIKQ